MKKTWKNGLLARVSALPLLCVGGLALVAGWTVPAEGRVVAGAAEDLDQIIFRDGKIVKGVIDKETKDTVSVFVVVGTIRGTVATVYEKKDVLSIIRGSGQSAAPATGDTSEIKPDVRVPDESAATSKKVVYHIKLDGILGRDFNVTPLKDAVNAAKALEPDYLLIEVDNLWRYGSDESKGRFDEFGIADDIEPILRQNIQSQWQKQPKLVVWVKNAMGGAAFIPFFTSNVYFTSDGRMGGIGDLGDLFGSTGDEVVRDKQKSLRLARAKGMAIPNGYDERLVEAMTWRTYVLYYTMEGGKPKYHTEPVPGAELLTDSGEGEFEDTMEQRIRGEGNDALTLRAELAQKLGVSRGTADSLEDLMFYLGVLDNYELVSDSPERIMDRWSQTIDRLEQEIPALFRQFNEINTNGQDYDARKQARGAQINILKKIIQKVERYQESLQWSRIGVPPLDQLRIMIEQIRLQQIADRP